MLLSPPEVASVALLIFTYLSHYMLCLSLLMQARNFRFNCGLVYVTEPGYVYLDQH
jgi:hypothetical protein